jgi:hypothetical protein
MSTVLLREIVARWCSTTTGSRAFVIVDHLQLVRGADRARCLIDLAREFQLAVFAVSLVAAYDGCSSCRASSQAGVDELRDLSTVKFVLHSPSSPGAHHRLEAVRHRRSRLFAHELVFNAATTLFEKVKEY